MDYFQDSTTQRFTFVSYASEASETTFAVLRFKGLEAISTPYEFEIMLVSSEPDLDMSAILQSQAVFTIRRDSGDDVAYNGILAKFDQLHAYGNHYFYRAKLVPKVWWLMQTQHNQVFLDKTVPEIVEGALADGGMDSLDYDLSALEGTYNPMEYVCQYGESHFNFVSRWLEREGVYYYFYHDIDGDKLVLSDSSFSHEPFQQGADLVYSPKTGMEQGHLDEIILNFSCSQKQLPNRIVMKDHNPERPSLEMAVHADVDPDGRGETFLYGEHYATPEEGERLIAFRAEELLCTKQQFQGDSTVPFLTPGFKFNLGQHYRSAFNQEYMVTGVTHEGDQTNLLKTSVIGSLSEDADINIYSNCFTAIPADRQYRHPRTADRPRISGTLHGKIDGEQDSPYPQLDEQGRYKVKLPFDINDEHIDGKASARVRMMQPYAGEGKGMQFPLTKGTEVLLTFIDGNPDRPLIAGAVSSETAPGPVNANNQSESVIRSAGNNRIRMEDKSGKERMVLQSPASGTWSRIGEPNDPMFMLGTSPVFQQEGEVWTDPGAFVIDENEKVTSTKKDAIWLRRETEVDDSTATDYLGQSLDEGDYIAEYKDGEDTVRRKIWAFDLAILTHANYTRPSAGMRDITSGSYWLEVASRSGSYTGGYPDVRVISDPLASDETKPNRPFVGDILAKFYDTTNGYHPKGLKDFKTGAAIDESEGIRFVMKSANVELSSFDTVTTQEGNIYDFGGYWNYNLGNSYEEAHTDQRAKLNRPGVAAKSDPVNPDTIWGDLPNTGGPGWTSLNWPNAGSGNTTSIPGAWHSDTVWTTKEFGDSYDFRSGNAVSVTLGSTLDVSYTGHTSVEVKMRDDQNPASYTHSSGGVTKEKKWASNKKLVYDGFTKVHDGGVDSVTSEFDRRTGALRTFNANSTTGMGTAEFEFDYSNTTSAKISSGANLKFSMDISATIFASINVSANIGFTANALDVDLKVHGVGVEMKLNSGKTEVSVIGMETKAYVGFFKFEAEPPTKIEQSIMKLQSSQIKLAQYSMGVSQATALEMLG